MTISSETGRYTSETQARNGITEPARKWFGLHNNNLGGTFHPLPADLSEEVGWWGTTLSDASGNLSPAPVLGFTHDARPVHTLQIVGDSKLQEYPVDFTVRLYGAGDVLLHTEPVTGNSSVVWQKALAETVQNVVKVTVTISKISRAGSVAKIVEGLNPFEIYRADQVAVQSAEASSLSFLEIEVYSNDTLLVGAVEQATPVSATLPVRTDDTRVKTTEAASGVIAEVYTSDQANVSATESGTIEARLPTRADTATVAAIETRNITVLLSSSDTLALAATETGAVRAELPVRTDQLMLAAGVEDAVTAEVAAADSLVISAAVDTDDVLVELPVRADALAVSATEGAAVTAELSGADTLMLATADSSIAVGTGRYTSVEQARDDKTKAARKYFSLHDNVLDDSYHPLPADYSEQVGWWGITLSGLDGSIDPPARLILDYDLRSAIMLRIAGDAQLGCYPVDFELRILNAEGTLLHTETVTGNNQALWTKRLDNPLENATRVDLTITRINRASSVAKIVEAMTPLGVVVEDSLSLSIVDARQATVHIAAEDVLTVAAAEVQDGIVVKLPQAADTLVARTEESAAITVQITSSDVAAALVAEVAGSVTVLLASQDMLTVAVGEAAGVMAHLASTDAISIATAEVGVVTAELPVRSDVLTLQAAEAGSITALLPVAIDQLAAATAAETSAVVAALDSNDELIIVAPAGTPAIIAELWATDPLAIVLAEERYIKAGLQTADILTVSAAEAGHVTALIASAIDLKIKISDVSAPVVAIITSAETVTITLLDGKAIQVNLPTRTDTMQLSVAEAQAVFATLPAGTDTLIISARVEDEVWMALQSVDVLELTAEGAVDLWNIHKLMDAAVRRVYGRVEITYTDPFLDESIEVTASETGRYTDPAAAANMYTTAMYKWFSLHQNVLDGTFHPLPASNPERVGWWSATQSNPNGEFTTPPKLTVIFEPRPIDSLQIFGDDKLQEYPVDFTIRLYDAIDVLLLEEVVTGNNSVSWSKEINEIADVTKTELEIRKISRPGSVAKILEFFSVLVEAYEGDDLISINLLEETESQGGTIPIGNVSANELSVILYNRDKKFTPANPDSRLKGLLKKNRRIRAWLGGEVIEDEIEWHPLGTFWTQDWHTPANELWAKTYAWDRLELLRGAEFSTSEVYQDKTLHWLTEMILQFAGLKTDQYEIDDSLKDIIIPYTWFGRISCREALRKIAAALPGRAYCNRHGKVVIEPYKAPEATTFNFTEDNTFNRDHPLAWSEIANYVTVKAVPRKPGPEEIVYQDIEEIEIGSGEQPSRTYLYLEPPVIDAQPPVITAGADITMVSYTPYAFGMTVVYRNNGAATQSITQVDINGKYLRPTGLKVAVAQDAKSIRDNGRIALPVIESEFIQTQARAQEIADLLLATYKDPRKDIRMQARGNIALQLGERVVAPDFSDEITGNYTVKRQELEWDGGLRVYVDGRKIAG